MLIVTAKLTVKEGKKQELLGYARDLISSTRQEEGCISYSLLVDPFDQQKLTFVEEWADKQALQAHFGAEHINDWRIKSKDLMESAVELKLFEAEETKL